MSQVTHLFKIGRKVKAYIDVSDDGREWNVHTGKPSDWTCIGFGPYATQDQALARANEYMREYCATPFGSVPYTIKEYALCRFFGDVKADIERKLYSIEEA